MEIRNEFAAVEVVLDTMANSHRLKITDLESGRTIFLDAFALRNLTFLSGEEFEKLVKFPE